MTHLAMKVSTISPFVRDWLSRTEKARVLQVFDSSCNILNRHNELISLVMPAVGPGPFSAIVDDRDARLIHGDFSTTLVVNLELRVDCGKMESDEIIFDAREAGIWDPTPDWASIQAHWSWLKSIVPEFITFLHGEAGPNGLLKYIHALTNTVNDLHRKLEPKVELQDRFNFTALEQAQFLLAEIGQERHGTWETALSRLMGLGSGLTPAWDDFILGVLHALGVYGSNRIAQDVRLSVIHQSKHRTNRLSAAYLRSAANGEASSSWHTLFGAIVLEDVTDLFCAAQDIMRFGHTSGADAIAGFAAMLGEFSE